MQTTMGVNMCKTEEHFHSCAPNVQSWCTVKWTSCYISWMQCQLGIAVHFEVFVCWILVAIHLHAGNVALLRWGSWIKIKWSERPRLALTSSSTHHNHADNNYNEDCNSSDGNSKWNSSVEAVHAFHLRFLNVRLIC